jgi:glycosyltransferase involved in cell wall biosynthesis|tara:strand:+ start:1145 stop:2077 length:933 start_codon:yes stop_codon:yes gene_type:complete
MKQEQGPAMVPDCRVFVFSFNRGPYLKNCIDSILRHAPGLPVTVVDDGSTDPETLQVLAALPVTVVTPRAEQVGRHGGLYANMQWALETCDSTLALFMQDDVQMVRDLAADDWQALQAFFDADPGHVFVHPCFPMGPRKPRSRHEYKPWPPFRGYCNDNGAADQSERSRRWVYDVTLCHAPRLRAAGWTFGPTERENSKHAAGLFTPMLHFADPFICQLPEVATLRFGRRTLGARLAEYLSGEDVKSFAPMTGAEIAALKARPLNSITLAEDVLRPVNPGVRRPFVHKGVNRRWYTRALNKLELAFRRRA